MTSDKKPLQDLDVILVCSQMQEIASGFLENAFTLFSLVKKILLVIRADKEIARIHPIPPARLGILCLDHPDGRQLHIHLIVELDPDNIMFFPGHFQGLVESQLPALRLTRGTSTAIQKIAEQKNNGILPRTLAKKTDGFAQVGALSLRFDRQQLTDDIKYMLPAFLRRYIRFDLVAEKYHADLVIVIDRRKSQNGAYLRDQVLFTGMNGAKKGTGTYINQENDREFAFFFK